jgi:hypothetical protein
MQCITELRIGPKTEVILEDDELAYIQGSSVHGDSTSKRRS